MSKKPAWYMRDDLPQRGFRRTVAVPYEKRKAALEAGAKWDALAKVWYVDDIQALRSVEFVLDPRRASGQARRLSRGVGR